MVRQIEDMVMEDLPWVVLLHKTVYYVWGTSVHNAEPGFNQSNDSRMDNWWVSR